MKKYERLPKDTKQRIVDMAKKRYNAWVIAEEVDLPVLKIKHVIYYHRKTHPGDIPCYYPRS